MTTMTLMDILMWALPSGFLASLCTWLVSRKTFSARNRKEREDIYRQLYESQGETLLMMQENYSNIQEQNIQINGKLTKMQQTLSTLAAKSVHCRYWNVCPLRNELSKYKTAGAEQLNSSPLGQSERDRHRGDLLRAGPEEDGESGTHTEGHPDADETARRVRLDAQGRTTPPESLQ